MAFWFWYRNPDLCSLQFLNNTTKRTYQLFFGQVQGLGSRRCVKTEAKYVIPFLLLQHLSTEAPLAWSGDVVWDLWLHLSDLWSWAVMQHLLGLITSSTGSGCFLQNFAKSQLLGNWLGLFSSPLAFFLKSLRVELWHCLRLNVCLSIHPYLKWDIGIAALALRIFQPTAFIWGFSSGSFG